MEPSPTTPTTSASPEPHEPPSGTCCPRPRKTPAADNGWRSPYAVASDRDDDHDACRHHTVPSYRNLRVRSARARGVDRGVAARVRHLRAVADPRAGGGGRGDGDDLPRPRAAGVRVVAPRADRRVARRRAADPSDAVVVDAACRRAAAV